MKYLYRYRRSLTILTLVTYLLAGAVTPSLAEYDPEIGRFLQRDPNEQALILANVLAMNGQTRSVLASMSPAAQYVDGLSLYQFVTGNPVAHSDPAGMFTYTDMVLTAGLLGGLYGLGSSYARFDDYDLKTGRRSNWKLAAAFAKGAGFGVCAALGFGWLTGALASYASVSVGVAATSIGMMTSPAMLGLSVKEYADAETYADRLMAGIDVGFSSMGIVSTAAAGWKVANPSTVAVLQRAANSALRSAGAGRGAVHGTRAHMAFRANVDRLGKRLRTEVSYLDGEPAGYGERGSIRVDVIEGTVENPLAVYEFKTGEARLTARRIQQIRRHLPEGCKDIPIVEIRGERP